MVMGRSPLSSSSLAMSIGRLTFSGISMRTGAPRLIWRALAPIILALSNRVSLGGPVIDFSELISLNPREDRLKLEGLAEKARQLKPVKRQQSLKFTTSPIKAKNFNDIWFINFYPPMNSTPTSLAILARTSIWFPGARS